MGTITTQILIGNTHTFHGGILPTHQMFLSENNRAAWILSSMSLMDENKESIEKITWIPNRPSTILRDGLMMIAYHIIKDESFRNHANLLLGEGLNKPFLDLSQNCDDDLLATLFEQCKDISYWPKLVITILKESYLETLELSKMNLNQILETEICFSKNIIG